MSSIFVAVMIFVKAPNSSVQNSRESPGLQVDAPGPKFGGGIPLLREPAQLTAPTLLVTDFPGCAATQRGRDGKHQEKHRTPMLTTVPRLLGTQAAARAEPLTSRRVPVWDGRVYVWEVVGEVVPGKSCHRFRAEGAGFGKDLRRSASKPVLFVCDGVDG